MKMQTDQGPLTIMFTNDKDESIRDIENHLRIFQVRVHDKRRPSQELNPLRPRFPPINKSDSRGGVGSDDERGKTPQSRGTSVFSRSGARAPPPRARTAASRQGRAATATPTHNMPSPTLPGLLSDGFGRIRSQSRPNMPPASGMSGMGSSAS